MNHWYRFKVKGTFDIDIIDEENEEEAIKKANKKADELVDGLKPLEVLACDLDESGEWED